MYVFVLLFSEFDLYLSLQNFQVKVVHRPKAFHDYKWMAEGIPISLEKIYRDSSAPPDSSICGA